MKTIAAVLLMTAALAGCAKADNGVATASGTPSATAPTAQTFSSCMADHGVQVADPAPGEGLTGVDPATANSPAFKTALAACKDLIPGGVRGSEAPADLQKYLEFAKCMRSNGLPDFPDPKPGSKDGMFGGSAVDRNNPAFQKAAAACNHVLG
ncbi:hypothetical protein ACFVWG_16805 [Kribbella sp. NPDC058245]|uniref:hypothetical protein n=1 Tax=Kribbella sp. NPDC058245 TaxID=3346399 RepID=UPI0036E578F3